MQREQRRSGGRSDGPVSELDKQIIARLQADGRRPFAQIAAELGMSEAAVRARANRLIAEGTLQVVGVADPLRLGYALMALIGVTCDGARLLAVADAVAKYPEAVRVVVTAGTFDLLVEVVCEDNDALLEFLSQKLGALPGVQASHTFVYLRIAKQDSHWGAPA